MGSWQSIGLSEQDTPQESGSNEFNPSETDVIQIRLTLLQFLPRELVDTIIDEAEYWCRTYIGEQTSTMSADATYAIHLNQHDVQWCYLLTEAIPGENNEDDPSDVAELKRPRRIRELIFTTESNDQGWGGPPRSEMQQYGPYHGVWSWFEASIVRFPDEPTETPKWLEEILSKSKPVDMRSPDESQITDKFLVGPSPRRWLVHCNRTADSNPTRHTTAWSVYDEDCTDDDSTVKGRVGRGTEFLSYLQPGDRIALLARAMFPGWANHVIEASIEIVYSM
ncbi:hypothetical protein L218DRAFT_990411 [Marasmius fiardii PR-910]|nr:hypothetical protein L218DRAFT_990411 [Marasmius fiardii PR-910]